MECGGLPPLYAVPACRGVLPVFWERLGLGEASFAQIQREQAPALHTRPIVSAASSFHRPILTIFSFPSSAPPRSHHDRTGNRHHRNHQHQQKKRSATSCNSAESRRSRSAWFSACTMWRLARRISAAPLRFTSARKSARCLSHRDTEALRKSGPATFHRGRPMIHWLLGLCVSPSVRSSVSP